MNIKKLFCFLLLSVAYIRGINDNALTDEKSVFLDLVKGHLELVSNHAKSMETLFDSFAVSDDAHADGIVQRMAQERVRFNKSMCDGLKNLVPRIGFYVYQSHERDAVLKKLQEHMNEVKDHENILKKILNALESIDDDWRVNDATTPELKAKIDQVVQDDVEKSIIDFKTAHCNAVGFGFIVRHP